MPQQSATAAGQITGRVEEWTGEKMQSVEVREKSHGAWLTVQACQAQQRTWGATLLWALLSLPPPPTRGDADKHVCIYCT